MTSEESPTAEHRTNAVAPLASEVAPIQSVPKTRLTSFQQDIIKILLDKLLIGLLLALVGFLATRGLDYWKSELSLSVELSKVRAARISSVWEAVYELDAAVNDGMVRISQAMENSVKRPAEVDVADLPQVVQQLNKELGELIADVRRVIEKERGEAKQALATSRFWIGDEAYFELSKLVTLLDEDYPGLAIYAQSSPEGKARFDEAEKQRSALRLRMTRMAGSLFGKGLPGEDEPSLKLKPQVKP